MVRARHDSVLFVCPLCSKLFSSLYSITSVFCVLSFHHLSLCVNMKYYRGGASEASVATLIGDVDGSS